MTPTAVTMMIVAILIVWGGLAASIIFLRRQPQVPDSELPDPDSAEQDDRLGTAHPRRDL